MNGFLEVPYICTKITDVYPFPCRPFFVYCLHAG